MSTSQCENSHNLTEYLTFCAQIVVFCCLGVFLSLCVWTHKIHRKCRAPPANLNFQKIQIGGKGKWHITTEKEERKWRLWKEAEEKILRAYGVDENIIEEIRIYDRAEFNSDRRFYRRLNDMEEYIEKVADNGLNTEIKTVSALLDEVENEHLYAALLKVDKHTLEIVLLKMQGYSTKEISAMLQLTEKAIYKRMDRLRKKLKIFDD